MPQLRKVVLAMGNQLIYRDTYQQAVAELAALSGFGRGAPQTPSGEAAKPGEAVASSPGIDAKILRIRNHLLRYRDLSAQGKWAEAGKELEAIQNLVRQ